MQLPGEYAPPRGRLLLALTETIVAGCVAFRPFTENTCEMKRLYVRFTARGQGVGRALVTALMDEAHKARYRAMRLETLQAMTEAQSLYRSLGFHEIAPYHLPNTDHDQTIFMERLLITDMAE